MSETLGQAATKVRRLLRDTDPGDYAVPTYTELFDAIISAGQRLGERAGIGRTWSTGILTATAGQTGDSTLPTSVQYHAVYGARSQQSGNFLDKLTLDEIDAMREGVLSSTRGQGEPTAFAAWEDETQSVLVRFNAVPTVTLTCDVLRSALPVSTVSASTVLPFADHFLRAIEMQTAFDLATKLPDADRDRLKLSPAALGDWAKEVTACVTAEKLRAGRISGRPYAVNAVVGLDSPAAWRW